MALVINEQGELVEVPDATPARFSAWEASQLNQAPQDISVESTPQGNTISVSGVKKQPVAPTPQSKGFPGLEQLQMLDIMAQKQRIADEEQRMSRLYERQAANQQTDISPLLALTDKWAKTNLSQNYKAPENAEARADRLAKLENMLQQRRENLTDDQMNLLKAKLMGQQLSQSNALKEKLINARVAGMGGGKTLPANEAAKLGEANSAVKALDDVTQLVGQNQGIMGPLGKGAQSSLQAYFQVGERGKQAAQLEAQLRARKQIIGRYLEGGVLRKEDEEKYEKMLPTLSDSPEVIGTKIDNLKRLIAQKQASEKASLGQAGYNVGAIDVSKAPSLSGATQDYNDLSDAELEALLQGN